MFLKILLKTHFLLDAHIFSASKQICNIKPNQKIHQIQSNWEKKEKREAIGFDLEAAEARSRGGGDWVMVGHSSTGSRWVIHRLGHDGSLVDEGHSGFDLEAAEARSLTWVWWRRDRWVGLKEATVTRSMGGSDIGDVDEISGWVWYRQRLGCLLHFPF